MDSAYQTMAFLFEERDKLGEDVLIEAACAAVAITINGKPFEPDLPVTADELADLLNDSLVLPGHNVRFDYEDSSYLLVTIMKPGLSYVEAHFGGEPIC
jgi:hypothetical protein